MVKKVVTTVGRFGDYIDEKRQSYELGFTPYRLHTNSDGTFVTPIRVYDGRVYVLDDVTTMVVTTRQIASDDNSKQIYFVKGDDDGGVGFALHGDRGDKSDPTVGIDIVAELCKHLPMEMLEQ